MPEVTSLEVQVKSDGFVRASDRMVKYTEAAGKAERATDKLVSASSGATKATEGLAASLGKLVGPMLSIGTVLALGGKLIDVTREFNRLSAGLETATGSAALAQEAFLALQDMASTTPNSLKATTDAFVKLANYGLTPSERALRSYGDTSAALGKDLSQMVEAVADAVTGEFERLKEFGVKASAEGDKVSFTFRGVKTTVGRNAQEIEQYLIKLGETNFAGAMALRMKTLDGALSNLGDSFDKLALAIAQAGVESKLSSIVRSLSSLIDKASEFVTTRGPALAEALKQSVAFSIPGLGGPASMFRDTVGRFFPEQKVITTEEDQQREKDRLARFGREVEGIRTQQNQEALKKLATSLRNRREIIEDEYAKEKAAIMAASSADPGLAGNLLRRAEDKRDKALAELDKKKERKQKEQIDILAMLARANKEARDKEVEEVVASAEKELETVRSSLLTQEEALAESYQRRKQIIEDNTSTENQSDLLGRLEAQYAAELELRAQKIEQVRVEQEREREMLYDGLLTEEEMLRASYDRRKKEILDSTALTEEQRLDLQQRLAKDYSAKQAQFELEQNAERVRASQLLFANLADVAKAWGGEQSRSYRALFALSKAFAVAEATLAVGQSIAKAQALGWPAGIAAGITAAAQGAQVLAMISGAQFSGAYDLGGRIPAGKVGLVGEYGPEFVEGPATVTSRRETARKIEQAAASPGQAPSVRVIAAFSEDVVRNYMASPQGERVYRNYVRRDATTIRTILGS